MSQKNYVIIFKNIIILNIYQQKKPFLKNIFNMLLKTYIILF